MGHPSDTVPLVFSQRFLLTVMAFFGNIFVYSARVNLSVAVLCMVRNDVTLDNNMTSSGQAGFNTTMAVPSSDSCVEDVSGQSGSTSGNQGEFDWDKAMRSRLLSMYFYGYVFTQIPGGWLASRYGGRRVWGVCMFVSSMCCLFTPLSARTHIYISYAIRFILGFAAGVTYPCLHALLGRWAPPYERSKLTASAHSGNQFGLVVAFAISGLLCEYGFDNGWGSIFYLTGIFNMIWVVFWFLLTADTPDEHKRITPKERQFIRYSIGKGLVDQKQKVPWKAMFKSVPLWAIITSHFCNNVTGYTLMTSLPTFMKEVFKFDIKQNGLLSAAPYVTNFIGAVLSGLIADFIIKRGWLQVKNTRKLFQTLCFLGTGGVLCIVVQLDCNHRYEAVGLLCLATIFISTNRAAYLVNHLDLAPSYAGIMFGITNTVATIPGMVVPIIAGALTPNKTPEEWKSVFYLCGAVCVLGAILYCVMADGELQEWSQNKDFDIVPPADPNDHKEKDVAEAVHAEGAGVPLIITNGVVIDDESTVA